MLTSLQSANAPVPANGGFLDGRKDAKGDIVRAIWEGGRNIWGSGKTESRPLFELG